MKCFVGRISLCCLVASLMGLGETRATDPVPTQSQQTQSQQTQSQQTQSQQTQSQQAPSHWPTVFQDDFEQGADHWAPMDPAHWKVKEVEGKKVFSHFVKQGKYQPPHRSPVNIALLKDHAVGDFELTVKVLSTHPDYGHRDAVVVFGFQDPAHFYYVHLGKQMDDHANQIFIVNGKPRVKISTKTTAGTPWDDQWHTVKVVRTVADGSIRVYFDDLAEPVMTATDKNFTWGRIGIGSFDDTTDWDDIQLKGVTYQGSK